MRCLKVSVVATIAALAITVNLETGVASASHLTASFSFPMTWTGSGSGGTLEVTPEESTVRSIKCTGSKSSGEIETFGAVKNVIVKYTGCADDKLGGNCSNTGVSGEIATKKIHGTLVDFDGTKFGMLFKGEGASLVIAEFTCSTFLGSTSMKVTGEVLGQLKVVGSTHWTFTFGKSAGHPIQNSYLDPSSGAAVSTTEKLLTSGSGLTTFGPRVSAIESSETITFSSSITIYRPEPTATATSFPVSFNGHGLGGTLEVTPEGSIVRSIACKGSTSSGKITSETTIQNVEVTLTGCTDEKHGTECTNTGVAGEVKTKKLYGTMVFLVGTSYGIFLKPEPGEGGLFAEFDCSILQTLKVTGEVLGELQGVNSTHYTLTFKKNAGHPIPSSWCGGGSTTEKLLTQGTGTTNFGPRASALEATQTLTLGAAVTVDHYGC